jgi:hypothetical protein
MSVFPSGLALPNHIDSDADYDNDNDNDSDARWAFVLDDHVSSV